MRAGAAASSNVKYDVWDSTRGNSWNNSWDNVRPRIAVGIWDSVEDSVAGAVEASIRIIKIGLEDSIYEHFREGGSW